MTAHRERGDQRLPASRDRLRFRVVDDLVVDEDGRVYDLADAILATRWVTATKYPPPHQYAVLGRTPMEPWDVLATAIKGRSDSYLAYFRGYWRPNRYLDLPDHRYWRTSSGGVGGRVTHMLNRCTYDSAEPPRRLDQGAVPITWSGPPWDVYGAPWPEGWRYDADIDRWVDPSGRPAGDGRRIVRRRGPG